VDVGLGLNVRVSVGLGDTVSVQSGVNAGVKVLVKPPKVGMAVGVTR
jgi:hypothetical protein